MPQFVTSKNLLQSTLPLVVGAVSRPETLASLGGMPALADECDLVELRLDSLGLAAADIHAHAAGLPVRCP
jgi:3-dehydroquinate dehydratase-1